MTGASAMLATIKAPTVSAQISNMWASLGSLGTFVKWAMIAVAVVLLVVIVIQYLFAAMRGRHKEHHKKLFFFGLGAIMLIDLAAGGPIVAGLLQLFADFIVIIINLFTAHAASAIGSAHGAAQAVVLKAHDVLVSSKAV